MTTRSVPAGSEGSACHTIAGAPPDTSWSARHVALAIGSGEDDDGGPHQIPNWFRAHFRNGSPLRKARKCRSGLGRYERCRDGRGQHVAIWLNAALISPSKSQPSSFLRCARLNSCSMRCVASPVGCHEPARNFPRGLGINHAKRPWTSRSPACRPRSGRPAPTMRPFQPRGARPRYRQFLRAIPHPCLER